MAASSAVDELDDHHVLLRVASQTLVNEAIQQEIREALEKALGHPFAVHLRRGKDLRMSQASHF